MDGQVEMKKPRPIWQEMPENVKGIVVQYLGYTDRCNLRRCSSDDKLAVDNCPVYIKKISLKDVTGSRPFQSELLVNIRHPYHVHFSVLPLQCAVKSFFKVVGIPNVKIDRLVVEYYEIPLLCELFNIRGMRKIAVESVHFRRNGLFDESVLSFISHLDFKKCIIDGECLPKMFTQLVEMEQWRNARGIHIPSISQFPIHYFLHLNSLRLNVEELSVVDGMTLIQTFINKSTFQHTSTFFQIHSRESMSPRQFLDGIDWDLHEKLTNIREENDDSIRVQQFKMTHSVELVFVVKATPTMLAGSVCRPLPQLVGDFMDSLVI